MSELTIVCWKWKTTNGWRPGGYGAKHVNALDRMLQEHLSIPYRLVCVTDEPKGVNCETYPIWDEPVVHVGKGVANCYRRLKLFSREALEMFGERVVSMDLDVLIRSDITDLFTGEEEFKITSGYVSPYNGSLWMLKTGTHPHVWEDFDAERSPQEARKLLMPDGKPNHGSDQAWISHKIKNAPVWTPEDGVCHFMRDIGKNEVQDSMRIIFFPGDVNPWSGDMPIRNQQIFNEYKGWL